MQLARYRWLVVGAGLLVTGVAWGQTQPGPAEGGEEDKSGQLAKVGQAAPDFTLLDCFGKKHTLSDHKDDVVVLEWVNQNCPWSVGAIPVVKDIQKKYESKGVVWLGVESTFWRTPEENAKYIKDKALHYPILMDNDGKVGRMYGAKTTPHVYVINKGLLVYMGGLHTNQHGDKKPGEVRNYLDEALNAVLEGKEVPLAETKAWGCTVKYKQVGTKRDQKQDAGRAGKESRD